MRRILPFAVVLTLGVVGTTLVVEAGKYSCRWTIIGYVCPDIKVSAR